MPVCTVHSVGSCDRAPDGLLDIFHATAQGIIIAGASMLLVDFHPNPAKALVDGPQARLMSELPQFLEDEAITRSPVNDDATPVQQSNRTERSR